MAILTKKQKAVFDFIYQYERDYGYAPSLNEIKNALGISAVSTIHEHIANLVAKGFVKRVKGSARSLELVKDKLGSSIFVPLVGSITCGEPLEALEERGDEIEIPEDKRFDVTNLYALRAKGDSMIEEGILENDLLIVKKQSWASNGDTVVAIIDDNEATLKRFYKEKNRIRLQPANSNYEPIFRTQVEVRGVVIKVVRDLIY